MGWEILRYRDDEVDAFARDNRRKARFLVDENLGPAVAEEMRDAGFNAEFVGEVGLSGRSDPKLTAGLQHIRLAGTQIR